MKKCTKCLVEKDFSEFYIRRKNGKILYQCYCKPCNKLYNKKHYLDNKSTYSSNTKKNKVKNYEKYLNYLKDKCCIDCNLGDIRVLEFDHVKNKSGNISRFVQEKGWTKILEEINKCDVVCANCHRIRTYTRINSRRTQFYNSVLRK